MGRLLHPMLRQPDGALARVDWNAALDRVARGTYRRIIERARPGRGRVLSLRPTSHRGLLRRQQADEGLHRLGQCRHQFAPVHGVLGRRPPPRLRRRHGARHLCRPRPGRSDRAGRLERRLVPSGAVPAHGPQQGRARRQASSSSIRAAPRRRKTPICFCPIAPGSRYRAVLRAAGASGGAAARSIGDYIDAHTTGFAAALARAREIAPDLAATARATGLPEARCRAVSSSCSARSPRVVTCYSQGVNQSAQGTDKVNAIINCHLATGRIGRPGARARSR